MTKMIKKQKANPIHKGGAIYSFDLTDKIGGLPARIPLNGTQDGDCPSTLDKDLGFTNYGMTRGGSRSKSHNNKKRHTKKTKTHHRKTKKNTHTKSRKHNRNTKRNTRAHKHH